MQKLLFRTLHAGRLRMLREQQELHRLTAQEAIPAVQRDRFNEIWQDACRRYRFYADWKRRFGLPDRIDDITDLRRFPVLRKADLQKQAASIAGEAAPCSFALTGGSTGTPARHPVTRFDRDLWSVNGLVGKSWSGILPGERTVLLWGHAHLLGRGWKRHVMHARKRLVDYVANSSRLSAYQLDEASLTRYAAAIGTMDRPVIYGYSSALRRLMDHMEDCAQRSPGGIAARAVIFTAEVCHKSDLERARRLFGGPALIEYGMIECGPIGYSTPEDSSVTMLWDAVYCHARPDGELALTTLQRRRFPYVNYGSEDVVDGVAHEAAPLFRCERILGRANDNLLLTRKNGSTFEVHSFAFMVILSGLPAVRNYVIHQQGCRITIRVTLTEPRSLAEVRATFLQALDQVFADLDHDTIVLEPLDAVPMTLAGKSRLVVRG